MQTEFGVNVGEVREERCVFFLICVFFNITNTEVLL